MTNSIPPGWYPVPGTSQERWWDGNAWAADVRQAGAPTAGQLADAPTQAWGSPSFTPPADGQGVPSGQAAYGYPPQGPLGGGYGYPGPPPNPNRNGLVIGISIAVVVVLVAAAAIGYAFTQGDGPGPPPPTPTSSTSGPATRSPSPSRSPSERPSPSPSTGSSTTVTDTVHALRITVPYGWTTRDATATASMHATSGPYDCGLSSQCVRGQFSIEAEAVEGTGAQSAAETAMANYAPAIFGKLLGHRELASGPIVVAGVNSYAVRWYVTPEQGAQGYVLLIAAPAEGGGFVLLHGGVDDDPLAPKPAVLEQIVAGIRSTDSGSGA
ncbi:DUF2510 domain-containing protein [Kitasatospora sp. NPDC048540]|uniref:DUF2510 domain-containing protein n=1 Tax=unclassified Kitasatospora TaxID=2633591 RepID=UPI000539ED28|nr:DUF2510 domain-containing protein [Kitasatospora sp. MBT63]